MSTGAILLPSRAPRPRFEPLRALALAAAYPVDVCLGAALPLLWALGHSYAGIEGDARIYMGRALADLDPGGVGRDMMFAMDGQSSFSLFRIVAKALASTFGLGPTVGVLVITSLLVWFVAATVLVRSVAAGRAAALVLATVCLLPRLYTPWNLLAAGEATAVPRPLAEAGVMFALAALCQGRVVLCVCALAAAAVFHPIMAAPGFGVLLVVLGWRDRRWFAAAAMCGVAAIGGAELGLPVLARLVVPLDPQWWSVLLKRNPYLFLHLWPVDSAGPIVVRAATIVLGATWLPPRPRLIFLSSLLVALLGCVVSVLFGDLLGSQLIMQAQLWRALWLPAVLAPIAAGLCLWRLPRFGAAGQIALAALSLAWIAVDTFPLAPVAALAALVAWFGVPRLLVAIGRPAVLAAWAACAVLAAVSEYAAGTALHTILSRMPPAVDATWNMMWLLGLPAVPIMMVVYAAWRWPRALALRIGAPISLAAGVILCVTSWNTETPAHADADAARIKPALVQMLASRPGEVLWLDGDDSWYWARRANWVGPTQGGGIVFSRDLAMKWHARALALIDAGLGTARMLTQGRDPIPPHAMPLDPERIATFCRRIDAPAWIVASLDPGTVPSPALGATIWSPQLAHWKLYVGAADVHWRHLDRYALIPCHSI